MSGTVKTYVLYGTKLNVDYYDKDKFEDVLDYIYYLYDVVNKADSPYKVLYNEDQDDYYFGYVIDEASADHWESSFLISQSFDEIGNKVTREVLEALDWMLLIHFEKRSKTSRFEYRILTVEE